LDLNLNDNHYQLKSLVFDFLLPKLLIKEIAMYHLLNRALNHSIATLPTLQSQHLFALSKEIRIQHEGEEYRLRLTRNNRLILTK
jgi:hemin uptake protein HemP